jgi:hypothetical protein
VDYKFGKLRAMDVEKDAKGSAGGENVKMR